MRGMISVAGVFGNGGILGVVDENGDVRSFSWPRVDFPNHVEVIKFGFSDGVSRDWMGGWGWRHEMSYVNGSNVLRIVSRKGRRKVVRHVFALPDEDVAVFSFEVFNRGLGSVPVEVEFLGHFRILESKLSNAVFYDEVHDAMVFYKGNYYFAVGGDRSANAYSCFRMDRMRIFGFRWRARRGVGRRYALGDVGGYLKWDLGSIPPGGRGEISVYMCCGKTMNEAVSLLNDKTSRSPEEILRGAVEDGRSFVSKSKIPPSSRLGREVERSLLTMRLLCDRRGGIIAAPEFDPEFRVSGGYRYVWGRDAAFIAYAFDLAGYHEIARKFYLWCGAAQRKGGLLLQRYWCDGVPGPCWGDLQLDETGSVLWGLEQHVKMSDDYDLIKEMAPAIVEMADALARTVDVRGLLQPCLDLWEERRGIHAYSTAAVYAGLRSAARMIEEVEFGDKVGSWEMVAKRLKDAFDRFFWKGGHYVRCLNPKTLRPDVTPDSSLLGLAVPYKFISPTSSRMKATVEWLEGKLKSKGGLLRYKRDRYFGGNPWIVSTLWLASYKAEVGRKEEAEKLVEWCLTYSNLGLMPEQVHKGRGEAVSAMPLGWSHAFYLMVLDRLKGDELNGK
nr:glycoside hydrolase family 15 protein [Candidatus Freyrarchaeum guaymaensis]